MNLRKLATLAKKQDQLLRVCFYLLLNLAENVKVEDKMRKRNVVGLLVTSLERSTLELLVLVSSFLLKLSVYRENKDEMKLVLEQRFSSVSVLLQQYPLLTLAAILSHQDHPW
ncbi:kinesin-associated protein 3-like [Homalodisca vitripennis]|uniref:kinesin-associated protein 3-like n=1 Tax=Homalodisca vitripennis TaxID=197043 RepID=UPI001EEB269A|nr:kinesin-associated protein 3-like [Homalodisca vitripennis]